MYGLLRSGSTGPNATVRPGSFQVRWPTACSGRGWRRPELQAESDEANDAFHVLSSKAIVSGDARACESGVDLVIPILDGDLQPA